MSLSPSGQTVAQRLQLKEGRRLAALNAPLTVSDLIAGDRPRAEADEADVVVLFVRDRAEFDLLLADAVKTARPDAIVWVAYPKLTSSLAGDLNRDLIHTATLAMGLKTVTQIAIDADWSAMRLKRL